MSIEKSAFQAEVRKLEDTKKWLEGEIHVIHKNDVELKEKIAALKKQSKGSYSEELEITQKLYEITHKNFQKYNEVTEQPYFARIDFREYRKEVECFYIGKFGLGDSVTGDEVVIDWRAPLADLYYSGTQGKAYYQAPVGIIDGELFLKRKFLIKNGMVKDIFDDGINEIILQAAGEEREGKVLIDEYLRLNLEESISSKLKDVVATIQKEQNDIIRAEKNRALIVQGSAGSGKTTVALHRLAYLLYKYKNKLSGEQILVVAPNKLFLDYISELLPNLGVDKVKQKTFEEISVESLGLKGKIYSKDKKLAYVLENSEDKEVKFIINSSKVKGTTYFKIMMDRYVRELEKKDIDVEDIKVEEYVLFEAKEIKRLYIKDLMHLPLNRRKDEIKRYFTLKLKEKIIGILDKIEFLYEYQIARMKKVMEDGLERREKLIQLYGERDGRKEEIRKKSKEAFKEYFIKWQYIDMKQLYEDFFRYAETFGQETDNKIPAVLVQYMIQELMNNNDKGIIDSDDLAPMLYLKFKIDGVPEKSKFQHIVIDEAQDYNILQLLVLKYMALNESFTIVGDVGQGIYFYKGIENWSKVTKEVFEDISTYVPLTQSYRSTVEIIEFANKVLLKQKNSLPPAMPVLRHGKAPEIFNFENPKDFAEQLDMIVKEVQSLGKNSIAIIGRTYEECKKIKESIKKWSTIDWELVKDTDKTLNLEKIIIPSYLTKGLEFDCTVVYNCNDEIYTDTELNKKVLYVALTRALHLEYIFYNGKISTLLL